MEEFLKTTYTLNDRTRVKILLFIDAHQEVCVHDIEHSFGMVQSRASRHLKILKEGGFLSIERVGKWAVYRVRKHLSDFRLAALKEIKALDIELPQAVHDCEVKHRWKS